MPRNTRSSTNTVSDICEPTSSQTQGVSSNLERRVAAIEAVLSRLLGGNITANQLSDFTANGGVITDLVAVASNEAGGWITDGTFTGVGISTLGWVMSDGNAFPIVQMVDGKLVYGFNLDGSISTGTLGGTNYAYVGTGSYTSGSSQKGAVSVTMNTLNESTNEGVVQFTTTIGGLYIACGGGTPLWDTSGDEDWIVHVQSPQVPGMIYRNRYIGNTILFASDRAGINVTGLFPLPPGGTVRVTIEQSLGGAGGAGADSMYAWCARIG